MPIKLPKSSGSQIASSGNFWDDIVRSLDDVFKGAKKGVVAVIAAIGAAIASISKVFKRNS